MLKGSGSKISTLTRRDKKLHHSLAAISHGIGRKRRVSCDESDHRVETPKNRRQRSPALPGRPLFKGISRGKGWRQAEKSRLKAAARSKAHRNLLKIRWVWRQADCQSAAGWQPAPQYFGGFSSLLVGRRPMRTARIGCPAKAPGLSHIASTAEKIALQ